MRVSRSEFQALCKRLKGAYPQGYFLPDIDSMETWYGHLCMYSREALERAITRYINEESEPPAPSNLIAILRAMREAPDEGQDIVDTCTYWVLEDMDGYFVNEVFADSSQSADQVADWFKSKAMDLSGTVLRRRDFKTYRRSYKRPDSGAKVSLEQVKEIFKGVEISE